MDPPQARHAASSSPSLPQEPTLRRRWDDSFADRLLNLRLALAEVLAKRGRGREALASLQVDDPGDFLYRNAAGRRILQSLKGLQSTPFERRGAWPRRQRTALSSIGSQLLWPPRWSGPSTLVLPHRVESAMSSPSSCSRAPASPAEAPPSRGEPSGGG